MNATAKIKQRPAETATGAVGALVGLLALIFHLDGQVVAYLIIVLAAVPAAVTWLVATIRGEDGQGAVGIILVVLLILILLGYFGRP